MGDFYISDKYLELREKWGKTLDSHCTGLVKQRTIMNNYAPVYATLEYYHSIFRWPIGRQLVYPSCNNFLHLTSSNNNLMCYCNWNIGNNYDNIFFSQGMSMRKWVSRFPSLKNGWKTITPNRCKYCMWKLVSKCAISDCSCSLKMQHLFNLNWSNDANHSWHMILLFITYLLSNFSDHAVSYVRRFCLGLLQWAKQQTLQKVCLLWDILHSSLLFNIFLIMILLIRSIYTKVRTIFWQC